MNKVYIAMHGSYLTTAFFAPASSGYEPLRLSIALSSALCAMFSSRPGTPVVPEFHMKLKNRPALVVHDMLFSNWEIIPNDGRCLGDFWLCGRL